MKRITFTDGKLALVAPAYAADPQTFKTEESATKFCHAGNVVWSSPDSRKRAEHDPCPLKCEHPATIAVGG